MFVSEKKFLPWSARRFSVDGVGKIFNEKYKVELFKIRENIGPTVG